MHRSEDTELMGGMSIERISVLAGDTAWEDMQNRGGMGGGMQIVMRRPRRGRSSIAEQLEQARLRRFRTEFNRYLLAFLGGATLQPTYVAVAEAPEGKADVLEVKNDGGQAVRLFVDQNTHMPLMLQYQEVRPRIMIGGPGGRGGAPRAPAAMGPWRRRREAAAPPPPPPWRRRRAGRAAMVSVPTPKRCAGGWRRCRRRRPARSRSILGDYKKVDGVMLPHRLTQAVDGKTGRGMDHREGQGQPAVKADLFEKK